MASRDYDWKNKTRGFPYKCELRTNKKYLKDRQELFNKSGNGWWWFPSDALREEFHNRLKEDKDDT